MNANEQVLLTALRDVLEGARTTEFTLDNGRSVYVTMQGDTFTLYDDEDKPVAKLQLVPV